MIYCNVCGAGYAHWSADNVPFHAPCPYLKEILTYLSGSPPRALGDVKDWALAQIRRWAPPISAKRVTDAAGAVGIDEAAALVAYESLIDEGKLRMDSVWGIRAT